MFSPPSPKRFKTSQDWQQEFEACSFWDRPARTCATDIPTYPWMPKNTDFKVTFKLGWK